MDRAAGKKGQYAARHKTLCIIFLYSTLQSNGRPRLHSVDLDGNPIREDMPLSLLGEGVILTRDTGIPDLLLRAAVPHQLRLTSLRLFILLIVDVSAIPL